MQAYGERAGQLKGTVEVEEVLTAIQARAALSFVQPPSQDVSACQHVTEEHGPQINPPWHLGCAQRSKQ